MVENSLEEEMVGYDDGEGMVRKGKWSMLEDEEVQKLTILDVQVTVFTSYLQGISLTPDNRQFINMELETFFQERPALKRKKQ